LELGYPSNYKPIETMRRFIFGQGNLAYIGVEKESRLSELQATLENRKKIFEIYKLCMDQQWIDFFEIDSDTLVNGSRHVWQPSFFRNILINNLGNSFALMFNRPFSNKVNVEVYTTSFEILPSVLKDIIRILSKRGFPFVQIWLFHPNSNVSFNLFEKKGFKTFSFVGMGKTLGTNNSDEQEEN